MATPPPLSLLTLLTISLLHLSMQARSTTHWDDVQVLKQLKSTITPSSIPPASCIDSWDFSVDPCDNLFTDKFTCGLRCDAVSDDSTSRVTELALDSAGYSAALSAVSWSLPFLQNLDFSNNNFSGSIPGSLSRLTQLQRLALSRNSLSGAIPDSLGSLPHLQEMYLDNNMLTGAIPPTLNALNSLTRLQLQDNRLSSEFPDLSQLTNLNFLDASSNNLSGELPAALPPSLIELVMRNNQIEGNIPEIAASLAWLQVVDLSHNKLSGSVPASLFTHPSLEQLTLSYNQFGSVQVPGNSGLTSPLISVDLSNNRIRGLLPGFMGLMPRLSALSLENNEFTGPIPAEYVVKVLSPGPGSGQLERLLLGGNYLFGAIPGGFLNLKPDSLTVRLGDNCLYRCPVRFFFCEGGLQKSLTQCRAFGPIIP